MTTITLPLQTTTPVQRHAIDVGSAWLRWWMESLVGWYCDSHHLSLKAHLQQFSVRVLTSWYDWFNWHVLYPLSFFFGLYGCSLVPVYSTMRVMQTSNAKRNLHLSPGIGTAGRVQRDGQKSDRYYRADQRTDTRDTNRSHTHPGWGFHSVPAHTALSHSWLCQTEMREAQGLSIMA